MSGQAAVQAQTIAKPTITPARSGILQRAAINTSAVHEVPPIVHEVLHSPGQPLDSATRAFMEPRFGHDFSGVRVHTDAKASESARSVNALAYTVGRDVVFGAGQYVLATTAGQRLLAHELTHTVQQGLMPFDTVRSLTMSQSGDRSEQEAETASETVTRAPRTAAHVAAAPAICLGLIGPLLARHPAALTPCTMNCTDPAFLALSPSAREAQLNAQCPQGFPATGNTFFGRAIHPNATSIRPKLLVAQSRAMRAMCLGGQDPKAFVLTKSIITNPGHRPAMSMAVDIDYYGQPYIMHEKEETEIDQEVSPVYDRIAFWSHYHKSIIPRGITSVLRVAGGTSTQRTWINPNTGKRESITVGGLYDLLKQESTGMQDYFNLLLKSDSDLTNEVDAFLALNNEPLPTLTRLKTPTDKSAASVQAFRQRIADDYLLLGGSRAQLQAFAGVQIAAATKPPQTHPGDRPFEKGVPAGTTLPGGALNEAQFRRPELGFISLPMEVVVALTEVGLDWGAIDFGGASGDVMHFSIPK